MKLMVGSIPVTRCYVAAFILKYQIYPKSGYVIGHRCGKGPRCIETSHFDIVSIRVNNQCKTCHNGIDEWEVLARNNGIPKADRTGTIYYHDCPHTPGCFRQIPQVYFVNGEFTSNKKIVKK